MMTKRKKKKLTMMMTLTRKRTSWEGLMDITNGLEDDYIRVAHKDVA